MNIQDALKETGKARKEDNFAQYAFLEQSEEDPRHELFWSIDGKKDGHVQYEDIFADNWQPYHEEKEIRPEKEGELWVNKFQELAHTAYRGDKLIFVCMNESIPVDDVLIGMNGWTRRYPPVEDEKLLDEFICEYGGQFLNENINIKTNYNKPVTVKVFKMLKDKP